MPQGRVVVTLVLAAVALMAPLAPGCLAGGIEDIKKEVLERLKELPRVGQVDVAIATLGHSCLLSVNRTRNLDLSGRFQCPQWTAITGKGLSYIILDMIGKTLRDFLNKAKVNGDINEEEAPNWFTSLTLNPPSKNETKQAR